MGGYYGFYYDWTYLLVIVAAVISMIASGRVNSVYRKYAKIHAHSGLTGAETAERLLHSQGIYDVRIEHVSGNLTDHYDPSSKVLRLSDAVYGASSIAAIGVAAHECGHAVQDAGDYAPLRIRAAIVPVVNFGAGISWPLILLGIILGGNSILIQIGILMFCAVVAFQLITLPVELNASARALQLLENNRILYEDENKNAKKVLSAAAMTYVAAAFGSILQLLRLILIARRFDRD